MFLIKEVRSFPQIDFQGESLPWASEVKDLGNDVQSDLKGSIELKHESYDIIASANSLLAHFNLL